MNHRVLPVQPSSSAGFFGQYGGTFASEFIMPALLDAEHAYHSFKKDPEFTLQLNSLLSSYGGRETPLYHAERLSEAFKGATLYLKREDMAFTGSHHINSSIAQALIAQRLGKRRLVAESDTGTHGIAVAAVAARLRLSCTILMTESDIELHRENVLHMRTLGADIIPITSGRGSFSDVVTDVWRTWAFNADTTYYVANMPVGAHPFPEMIREFQSVIGRETRQQMLTQTGQLPDSLVAYVGGGAQAIGLFHPMLDDASVNMIGVEPDCAGASLHRGSLGVLHGNATCLIQNPNGQVLDMHSPLAGMSYPGVGPEHAYLKEMGRVDYTQVNMSDAADAFSLCSRLEGIVPSLESAHALAEAFRRAPTLPREHSMVINITARGDNDLTDVRRYRAQHALGECS